MPLDEVSRATERKHQQRLRGYISRANTITRKILLPVYQSLWAQQWGPQRLDADPPVDIVEAMSRARIEFERVYDPEALDALAMDGAAPVVRAEGQALKAQIKSLIGVTPLLNDSLLSLEMTTYGHRNVGLITSISDRYFAEIEQISAKALAVGTRPEVLSKDIQRRYNVGKSRANLIARDQLSKLHGQVAQIRQQGLGIEEYIWQTSEDERVRETHAAHNGETIRWDDPPADTGHVGQDFQCRCTGSPVLPSWMTAAAAEAA